MTRPKYLVIITGLSGSGKSYVQSTLEDLGFYCSDNLPLALIEPFLEEAAAHENATRVGIVVDVRTHDFAKIFPSFYRDRIQKLGPNSRSTMSSTRACSISSPTSPRSTGAR